MLLTLIKITKLLFFLIIYKSFRTQNLPLSPQIRRFLCLSVIFKPNFSLSFRNPSCALSHLDRLFSLLYKTMIFDGFCSSSSLSICPPGDAEPITTSSASRSIIRFLISAVSLVTRFILDSNGEMMSNLPLAMCGLN